MKLKVGKKYKDREGCILEIIAILKKPSYTSRPVVAIKTVEYGEQEIQRFCLDGKADVIDGVNHPFDIVEEFEIKLEEGTQ